ncbi:MAG: protein translocase subunit SecF [Patescibacteria group bacterium]|nr:protein translocase subunit SecF [Patescibacteria group bacterium]MCL5093617.1 protein translocase subunit SecF [Patescibacteria group bacterium]
MNIIKYRKLWYLLSLIFIIPGTITLILWGLKLSIDFTGGTLIEIEGTKDKQAVEKVAKDAKIEEFSFRETDKGLILRGKLIDEAIHKNFKAGLDKIKGAKEIRVETVGPAVSKDITRNAFISIGIASLIIIVYIAYSFRAVPKPASSWEFGIAAVIALLHDVLVVTGIFAILGHFKGVEVDSLFITAMLTVIGFSVHDTIVIFDRIRENLIAHKGEDFEEMVNLSVFEMLPRTLSTSYLAWVILVVLYLFGGESIKYFILALIIGIFSGTYSSILNASPLLVTWQNRKR